MITYQTEGVKMPAIKRRETTAWIKAVAATYGKKVGDIVHVQVNESFGYDAKVIKIEKGTDDEDLPIMKF